MPLICFVTRCHPRRPKMLAVCTNSITSQSCNDYEHFLFHDDTTKEGYGMHMADLSLRNAKPLNGEYIMVLDDDDRLVDDEFVKDFKAAVSETKPDVVIFKGLIGKLGVMPRDVHWGHPPTPSNIGSFCFAVKKEMWEKYIKFWDITMGDGAFIAKCYANTDKVLWLNKLVAATQRISEGSGE